MDTCLRFRKKSHQKAHSKDLTREFKFKSTVCLFGIMVFCLGSIIDYSFHEARRVNAWKVSIIIFSILAVLSLPVLYWISFGSNKITKYRKYLVRGADFIILLCCVFLIVNLLIFEDRDYGRIGFMLFGWVLCTMFHSIFDLVGNFGFRIVAYFCTLAAIFIPLVLQESDWDGIICAVIEAFLIYAFYTYNSEKYEKISYLERYRANNDFRTVTKILGDVIEGIVIIDEDDTILYSNEAVSNMIGDEEITVQSVFSKLKVRAVNNPEGTSVIPIREGEEVTLLFSIQCNLFPLDRKLCLIYTNRSLKSSSMRPRSGLSLKSSPMILWAQRLKEGLFASREVRLT